MKKAVSIAIGCLGSLLWIAGSAYYGLRTGLYMVTATNWLFLWPMLLALYLVVAWRLNQRRAGPRIGVGIRACFWLLPSLWVIVAAYSGGTPRAIFQRLLGCPMPPSVRDFAWRGGVGIDGFFNLTFTADPADVKAVIAFLHLEQDTNFESLEFSAPQAPGSRGAFNQEQPLVPPIAILSASQSIGEYASNKVARTKLPYQPIKSPVIYTGARMQLITDSAHHRVYIFM